MQSHLSITDVNALQNKTLTYHFLEPVIMIQQTKAPFHQKMPAAFPWTYFAW